MSKICKKCKAQNSDNSKYCCQCGAELNVSTANKNKKENKLTFKDGMGCVFILLCFCGISYVANEVLQLHNTTLRLLFGIGCVFALAFLFGIFYVLYMWIFHKDE